MKSKTPTDFESHSLKKKQTSCSFFRKSTASADFENNYFGQETDVISEFDAKLCFVQRMRLKKRSQKIISCLQMDSGFI